MRRPAVFAAAFTLLGTWTSAALAAGDCPDGDWFCEPAPEAAPPPSEEPETGQPERRPGRGQPGPQRGERRRQAPPPAFDPPPPPPPYGPDEDASDREIRIDVPEVRPARPRHRRGFREWGVNLHANVGLMGNDPYMSPDADMNGVGGALRFRPIPHIAIEGAVELMWGTDYNGFQRFEQGLMVSGLFYVNPRSAVQLYGVAGFGFATAFLDSGVAADGLPVLADETYRYSGGQLGVGVEGRVTRHFALGADLIGFLRWRNDRGAADEPEFIDPVTHQTSNTSAGGLLRLGATFYW